MNSMDRLIESIRTLCGGEKPIPKPLQEVADKRSEELKEAIERFRRISKKTSDGLDDTLRQALEWHKDIREGYADLSSMDECISHLEVLLSNALEDVEILAKIGTHVFEPVDPKGIYGPLVADNKDSDPRVTFEVRKAVGDENFVPVRPDEVEWDPHDQSKWGWED